MRPQNVGSDAFNCEAPPVGRSCAFIVIYYMYCSILTYLFTPGFSVAERFARFDKSPAPLTVGEVVQYERPLGSEFGAIASIGEMKFVTGIPKELAHEACSGTL